jgi:Ribbon-helix-helix protein, copG family
MSIERPEGLIDDAGRRGEPRRLDQMISARLDPMLVAALRKLAETRGVSLSDVLRDAALQLLAREEARNVRTFCVEVTNETRPEARHDSYRQDVPLAVLQLLSAAGRSRGQALEAVP